MSSSLTWIILNVSLTTLFPVSNLKKTKNNEHIVWVTLWLYFTLWNFIMNIWLIIVIVSTEWSTAKLQQNIKPWMCLNENRDQLFVVGRDRKKEIVLLCLIGLFQPTPPALALRSRRGYISCGAPFHLVSLTCLDFSLSPSFMWQLVQLLLQLYLFWLNHAISVCVCVWVRWSVFARD